MNKIHPDAIKIIDRVIDYKWQFNKLSGISIGIVSNNKTIFAKGYGFSNIEKKKKTGALTTYRIASVSKVFTALGILKLVQQNKLKLNDPVVKYLPEFASPKQSKQNKITIRQLLTHKSLIARDGSYGQWEIRKFPNAKSLLAQAKEGIVFTAPETKWKYSNFGYSILGLIIEKASGLSYEDFVQENFIKPLSLKHTSSMLKKNITDYLAMGYVAGFPGSPQHPVNHSETKAMASATGFSSNSQDLIEFAKAIINRSPKLLNKKSWDLAYKKQWAKKNESRNLFLWLNKNRKTQTLGHGGAFPGFVTRFSIDVKNKLGVIILINMNTAPGTFILRSIYSTLDSFPTLLKKLAKLKTKASQPKRYEGRFINLWGAVEVVSVNGQLIAFEPTSNKPVEETAILEHLKGNTFKIHDPDGYGSNGELVEFGFSKNGKVVSMNWAGHYHKKS